MIPSRITAGLIKVLTAITDIYIYIDCLRWFAQRNVGPSLLNKARPLLSGSRLPVIRIHRSISKKNLYKFQRLHVTFLSSVSKQTSLVHRDLNFPAVLLSLPLAKLIKEENRISRSTAGWQLRFYTIGTYARTWNSRGNMASMIKTSVGLLELFL